MAKSSKQRDKRDPVSSQKPKIRHKKGGLGSFLPVHWKYALITGLLAITFSAVFNNKDRQALPRELRKHPSPPISTHHQFQGDHAHRYLWGTYRPGYYFGMQARVPQSPIFGMMWLDPTRNDVLKNVRHEAKQDDGLSKYGWLSHDGETFGYQEIHDGRYRMKTSWIKNSDAGQDWTLRLECESIASEDSTTVDSKQRSDFVSFIFYVGTQDDSAVHINRESPGGTPDSLLLESSTPALYGRAHHPIDGWSLGIVPTSPVDRERISEVHAVGVRTPHMHNLTNLVTYRLWKHMIQQYERDPHAVKAVFEDQDTAASTVAFVQVTAVLPISLDVTFLSSIESEHLEQQKVSKRGSSPLRLKREFQERSNALTGSGFSQRFQRSEMAFARRFKDTFGEFNGPDVPEGAETVAKAALSNLLGGMGYWHGNSLAKIPGETDDAGDPVIKPLWPASLFSTTPSRSFFPRGFLWDEGFHQLLLRKWNPALSREVLAHWLDLMTASGWIPREQILGEEARARVPEEFVVQSPDAANPPTLFLPLVDMAQLVTKALAENDDGGNATSDLDIRSDREFLRAAWPRLMTWLRWYNSTQKGSVSSSYRWRGREEDSRRELNPKTLTSGLDDYPRASHPSDLERHVDLRCWLAIAAKALATVGEAVGAPQKDIEIVKEMWQHLSNYDGLKTLHWDSHHKRFADWGLHTEDVVLAPPEARPQPPGASIEGILRMELERTVTGESPTYQFVPHYGYVSLFPLLLELIPSDAPELGIVLEQLRDENELWTDAGLRSLSKNSTLYHKHNTEHDPPYWRGAIWININYLAVKALKNYEAAGGPYASVAGQIARDLRSAVVGNIVKEYQERRFLFEQYDDVTGKGQGCYPFTGWTALVALMAADG